MNGRSGGEERRGAKRWSNGKEGIGERGKRSMAKGMGMR